MIRAIPLLLLTACASAPTLEPVAYQPLPQFQGVIMSEPLDANQYTVEDCERPLYRSEEGDVWLTPKQFTERGAGDCEDYAICYFYAFKQLGLNPYIIMSKDHAATVVDNKVYDMGRVFDYTNWKRAKQPVVMFNENITTYFKE